MVSGADKSLARPGMKQARQHVRDARDFNNIETRVTNFFPARQGTEGNSRHSDRNISMFPSCWLRTYQHPCICHTGLLTACEQDQDRTILILLASCQQTCMTYTIAVCTVKNS